MWAECACPCVCRGATPTAAEPARSAVSRIFKRSEEEGSTYITYTGIAIGTRPTHATCAEYEEIFLDFESIIKIHPP